MKFNLNKREKVAVYAAGFFVSVFLFVQIIIAPVFNRRSQLADRLEAKTKLLFEMKSLQSEYVAMKNRAERSKQNLGKRPAGFTLFSFLDSLAGETGMKDSINYMKPSSVMNEDSGLRLSRVEMKLQGITLNDLTSFLYRVETSENMVVVRRLSITRTGQVDGLITAVLQVETVES